MKSLRWLPSVMVIAGLMMVASCKEDEAPRAKLSFSMVDDEIYESDGTLESFHPQLISGATGTEYEVTLLLDKPLAETAVIAYTVDGTATRNSAFELGDYEIDGNYDYITLGPGATQVTITINVFEDFDFEFDEDLNFFETITITLDEVISGPIQLDPNAQNTFTLNIYEDDSFIFLNWPDGDVDMDMFLWFDDPSTTEEDFAYLYGSFDKSTDGSGGEAFNIPAGFPNAKYALSYTYFAGTASPLNFTAQMLNFGGTLNGSASELTFNGSYSAGNINVWNNEDDPNYKGDPLIAQTMTKAQLDYTGISNILLNSSSGSSRLAHLKTSGFSKAQGIKTGIDPKAINKILKLK
jgi:hypothetical protein